MRTIHEYVEIFKKKGLRYSFHEFWIRIQRLHWIRDNQILSLQHEDKTYRYLQKYNYVLKEDIKPVTKSNPYPDKIWICWLQGVEQAPEIVKECIKSTQKNSAGFEVVILTNENIDKYISFPKYILEKYKKGIITRTHFSDILRIALLAEYGGIWIDSTVLVTEKLPDYITSASLFCYKSSLLNESKIKASSWFIAAKRNNKILSQTRNYLYTYWKHENFLKHYFLFHLIFSIVIDSSEENKKAWNEIPYYNNVNPHVLQFELFNPFSQQRFDEICKYAPLHKLSYKIQTGKVNIDGTFYEKIITGELN